MAKQDNQAPEDEKRQITIQKVNLTVSQPYAEGQTINAAEAKALNQTRAENIGNNLRKKIDEMRKTEGMTEEKLQVEAQKLMDEYDSKYEFTLASTMTGSRLSPLEKEAKRLAKAYVSQKLAEKNISQKSYKDEHGEDSIAELVAKAAAAPQIIEVAKANLAETQKLSGIKI